MGFSRLKYKAKFWDIPPYNWYTRKLRCIGSLVKKARKSCLLMSNYEITRWVQNKNKGRNQIWFKGMISNWGLLKDLAFNVWRITKTSYVRVFILLLFLRMRNQEKL